MFCRKCGKEIPDDSEFCYKCGAKMIAEALDEQKIEQAKPEDSSLPVCSKCGKPIPTGNMFCPNCGTDIPSVEIVSEKAPAPKKRPKKGMIIGIVAAAAVAVFAAIFIPIQVNVHKNPFPEFEYHLDDEGRYTIDKYMGNETDVVVPDAIKDKPVYTITEGAFSGSGISSVQLGKDVRIIGGGAFADCKNLEKVAFSYEDTDNSDNLLISDQAFKNCSKLKSVDFPIVAIHIFSEAFYNCSSLAEIDLSLTLSIGDSAFENCSSLFSVRTMNVEFTPRCFANCSSLYMVRCESCGNLIARQAFSGCTNLTMFTVAEKEYSYPSELENAGIVVGAGAFNKCDNFKDSEHENGSNTSKDPDSPKMTYDTIINSNGYYEDVCDYVFYDDPSVYGKWKTVGFVESQNFKAWESGTVKPIDVNEYTYVQELELLSNSNANITYSYGIEQIKWTNGFVLCEIDSVQTINKFYTVFIDDVEYLVLEHKSGYYISEKGIEGYFILTRKSGTSGNNFEPVTPTSRKLSDYVATDIAKMTYETFINTFGDPEESRFGSAYYDGVEVKTRSTHITDSDNRGLLDGIVVFGGKERVVIDDVHLGEGLDYYNARLSFDVYDALEIGYEIQGLGSRYELPVEYTKPNGDKFHITYRFNADTMISNAAEVEYVPPQGWGL